MGGSAEGAGADGASTIGGAAQHVLCGQIAPGAPRIAVAATARSWTFTAGLRGGIHPQ
jgi:hypothetical protein